MSLVLGAPAEQKPATLGPGISAQRLGLLRSGMRQSPHPWLQRAPQVPETMAPRAQQPQCCPGHGSVHFSSTVTHVLLCEVPLVPSSPGLWAPTWGQEAAAESKVGGEEPYCQWLCWKDPGVSWEQAWGEYRLGSAVGCWAMGIGGRARSDLDFLNHKKMTQLN